MHTIISKKKNIPVKGEVDYEKVSLVIINSIKQEKVKNITFDRIDEIVSTISKIIKRTTSSFSPEFINSTNLYFNGLNSKSIASFGTLNEFLSQFNGVKYSGSIPIGLYDNQGDKELEIKFNSGWIFCNWNKNEFCIV